MARWRGITQTMSKRARALKADPKMLAKLGLAHTPVPKSALLKMLHSLAEQHGLGSGNRRSGSRYQVR
jgi:hypothetical protein